MTEIRIDEAKAGRMIAQILRDEHKLTPDAANKTSATICMRLLAAMSLPTHQPFQGARLIRRSPPLGGGFTAAVGMKLADVNERVAEELWKLVYDRAEELPPGIADAIRD